MTMNEDRQGSDGGWARVPDTADRTTTRTTHPTTALWRRIATTTAIVVAAVSVATATATTADARPPKKPGATEYVNCVTNTLHDINNNGPVPDDALHQVMENCCVGLGGIYDNTNNVCALPNGEVFKPPQTLPHAPPGATVGPQPGLNTQGGKGL